MPTLESSVFGFPVIWSQQIIFSSHIQNIISNKIAHNGLRVGERSPVLRLRQGYGACTLLGESLSF
jgi:hypothetical protein